MTMLERLPAEIVLQVVTCPLLDPADLVRLGKTCKVLRKFVSDEYIWYIQAAQNGLIASGTKSYHDIPSSMTSCNNLQLWSVLVGAAEQLERQYGWSITGERRKSSSVGTTSAPLTQVATKKHTFPPGDQTLAIVPQHDAVLVWRKDRRHRRATLLDLRTTEPLWSYCPARWAGISSGVHSTFGAVQTGDWLAIGWNWLDFPVQREEQWISIHHSTYKGGDELARARFAWTMDVELVPSKHAPQFQLQLPHLLILDSDRQVLTRVHLPSGTQMQMLVSDYVGLPNGLPPTGVPVLHDQSFGGGRPMAQDRHNLFVPSRQGYDYSILNLQANKTIPSLLQMILSFDGLKSTCSLELSHSSATLKPRSNVPLTLSTRLCNVATDSKMNSMVLHAKLDEGVDALLLVHQYDTFLAFNTSDEGPSTNSQCGTTPYILTIVLPPRPDPHPIVLSTHNGRAFFALPPDRKMGATISMTEPHGLILDWKFASNPLNVQIHQLRGTTAVERPNFRRKSIESLVPLEQTLACPVVVSCLTTTSAHFVWECTTPAGRTAVASTKAHHQVLYQWDWSPTTL